MSFLLPVLIVAAVAAAPIESREPERTASRQPDAVEVFHCGFEEQADHDLDAWPDGWVRQRGPNYPVYLPIKILDTDAPEGHGALCIKLNGGAAALQTPPIPIGSQFSYVLEAYVKTEGLKEDRACLSLNFYDSQGKLLETFTSPRYQNLASWTKVRLGPVTAVSAQAHSAVIRLQLEPGGERADLRGAAWFDDIWLARLPRMSLHTNRADNLYLDASEIDIFCEVSGIFEADPMMRCELLDAEDHPLAAPTHERLESKKNTHAPAVADSPNLGEATLNEQGFVGSMHWKPAITRPGFYRARVTLEGTAGKIIERQLTLAVIEPARRVARGEFGWTLPVGDRPLSYAQLAELLPQVGIQRAKFPVWLAEKDMRKLDELMDFTMRLSARGIDSVGLLVDPPADVRPLFGDGPNLTTAAIFSTEPELWYKSVEPVTTRLSLQVHWWQLGADDDLSFVGDPNLAARIAAVKKELEQFGQSVHLGFGWRVMNQIPRVAHPPWDFLCLNAIPPLTAEEWGQYLSGPPPESVARWVELVPLARGEYTLRDRAADLVQRMVSAKRNQADAIFIPNPFDPETGLMNPDGTPGELLLPWRTTALALAGAEYLGSLTLSGGSQNHVFLRDGEIVMVVWNDRPVEERIYLGENVRQVDVWGQSALPRQEGNEQVIPVGPLPSLLVGLSEPIVRYGMGFEFDKVQLPSVFGIPHENGIRVKNFFPQGAAGQIRLHTPESWQTSPRVIKFKLAAGETLAESLTIRLPFDATNGSYPVRVDFDIRADREYHFSVYRSLEVGLGDLTVEMTSHLNAQGDLVVEQCFTNKTDQLVSFKCSLYAPDRRRLGSQVTRLGAQRDTKTYRFPRGRELIGKTIWLRAEEIGGDRTFNCRFIAKE